MIARGFRSVVWVAAVGGAALGCYMLSLQVATERADLAKVERRIIAAKQQIRSLQTELGTRGRLSQLEQWNADVLALSAPATGQFLGNEVLLARFDVNAQTVADNAEVRMASMETGEAGPAAAAPPAEASPRLAVENKPAPAVQPSIVHRAGYVTSAEGNSASPPTAARKPAPTVAAAKKPAADSPRPARRLGAELSEELSTAARGEKPAAPAVARPDRTRTAVKGDAPTRDSAPARTARADSARPAAGPTKPAAAKPGASRTAAQTQSRSGAGGGGNR